VGEATDYEVYIFGGDVTVSIHALMFQHVTTVMFISFGPIYDNDLQ
jgi:hypothetical protein